MSVLSLTPANGAVHLPYTLQTWVDMVMNGGSPQHRKQPAEVANIENSERIELSKALPKSDSYPVLEKYTSPNVVVDVAAKFLQELNASNEDNFTSSHWYAGNAAIKRYVGNLSACVSDVSKEDLKRHMLARTRFDLEQAAAVVVSAFMTDRRVDDAAWLIKELGMVLAASCMWIEPDVPLPTQAPVFTSPQKLARKLQLSAAKKGVEIPLATSYRELLPLLMRVRRSKPDDRCLVIPQWMFEEAGIEPTPHFKASFDSDHPAQNPIAPRETDSIILSRKHFRCDQRAIYRLFRYWKPDIKLRKSIKKLEDKVLYGGTWIQKRVFDVDDVALLSHYFFSFQRRLQRKVVSNITGGGFLGKGMGQNIYQNSISTKSTFENVLLDIAESNEKGVIVTMGDDNTLALIDETCLLMKEYVDLYGGGNTQNLTFKKGEWGGSGRGPVDEYNLLCDVLASLRQQAKDEGIVDVPGPTYKFLAKDIMHYNDSWDDDAFANGREAGWEDWVRKRGLMEDEWDIVVR